MPRISVIGQVLPELKKRKRVAAYARVSMETEMLLHSLSAQVSHYNGLIQKNPDWEFAGIYADEGISGRDTSHRDDFNRLLADCDAGKIDMVLVKSISRFARDTVDTLTATRHLKELGIDVYFEREHIHSISDEGELLLTLLASFAQEESRSISENVKWGIRKRFEQGIPNGHKAPYGYEWDGEMYRVIPEQDFARSLHENEKDRGGKPSGASRGRKACRWTTPPSSSSSRTRPIRAPCSCRRIIFPRGIRGKGIRASCPCTWWRVCSSRSSRRQILKRRSSYGSSGRMPPPIKTPRSRLFPDW